MQVKEAVAVPKSDSLVPRPYTVQRIRRETRDTFTMELRPVDGQGGMKFRPGQFNMLYVFGVGEVPISISGDPVESTILAHTTRATGTVTQAMHALRRGEVMGIRGPFGNHWPVEETEGRDVVIVAGGIGLAPLRPVLHYVLARRSSYGKVVLLYGAREPAELLYKQELAQWRAQFDLDVHVTVDRAVGAWRGTVGFVTTLIPRAPFYPENAVAMVCGPEIMMRFAVLELLKRGVAANQVYVSMERNMKCGMGLCGHCQHGPHFVCRDGPVFSYDRVEPFIGKREV